MRDTATPLRLNLDEIRERARGEWHGILSGLGIMVSAHPKQHGPCPACGGKDRFRFDDKAGRGTWFCNQCDPHAGDGFALVMNVRGCAFAEALPLVASMLGMTPSSHTPRPHRAAKPIPVDRVKLAFKFDMAALARQLRANRILETAKRLDVSGLSEAECDRALAYVAQACADLKRAELLEDVADDLRTRDFLERKARERQSCAA